MATLATSGNLSICTLLALSLSAVVPGISMKTDLKLKFRVAILRHVAAEQDIAKTGDDLDDDETPTAPGMSFFTAVR